MTVVVATSDEKKVLLDSNGDKSVMMPIDFKGVDIKKSVKCMTMLYSEDLDLLDSMDLMIKVDVPKIVLGKDPRSVDDIVRRNETSHEVIIVPKRDMEPIGYQCNCRFYDIICVFKNFGDCFRSFFDKAYMYIVIVLGVILLLILLPVIIPLISQFIKFICRIIKKSFRRICNRNENTLTSGQIVEINGTK